MDHCDILLVYFVIVMCSSSVHVSALQCPSCHRVQNVNQCREKTENCSIYQEVCIGVLDEWHVTMGCGTIKRCDYDALQDTTDCRGTHPFGPRDRCTVCCTGDICQSRMNHIQQGLDAVPGVIHCPVCDNEQDPHSCLDNIIPCEPHHKTCEIKNIDGKWSAACSLNSSCIRPPNLYPSDCTQNTGRKDCVYCCNDHACLDYAFGIKQISTAATTTTSVGGTSATLTFAPPSSCRDQSLFPCHRAVGAACSDPDISVEFCPLTCGVCKPSSTTATTQHASTPSVPTPGEPSTTLSSTKHTTHVSDKHTTHSTNKQTTHIPDKHTTHSTNKQSTHAPTTRATQSKTTQIHEKPSTHMSTHRTTHASLTHRATAAPTTPSSATSTTQDVLVSGPEVGVGCPNGYTQYEESCYFHHHQKMTFIKASVYCRQHQGHLTEIETAEENAFVKAFLKDKIISNGVWLGANDIRFEGYYVWDKSEKPLNYTDWYPGEPNQKTAEQDCMSSWKSEGYQWSDHYCDKPDLEPLCEAEMTKCS